MRQLVLKIEDKQYQPLLQFLKTLEYVRIVSNDADVIGTNAPINDSQVLRLKQKLEGISNPLFQQISDPVAWQKEQRDEWA